MNEYQKALMEIEEIAYKQYEDACYNKTTKARAMEYERKLKDDTKILQELIDKETPKKPENIIHFSNRTWEICPVCGVSVYLDDHDYYLDRCENCGQKIDWSDHNE